MSKVNIKIFKFLLVLILIITVYLIYNYLQQCSHIKCLKFSNIENYTLDEIYENSRDNYRASYKSEGSLIKINIKSNIESEYAIKEIDASVLKMQSLFANAASPYPGEISDTIVCGDEYKPVLYNFRLNNIDYPYFIGYLNDRLVFGVCDKSQIYYQGLLGLFYCTNQKKMYQVEYIKGAQESIDYKEFTDFLSSIKCL